MKNSSGTKSWELWQWLRGPCWWLRGTSRAAFAALASPFDPLARNLERGRSFLLDMSTIQELREAALKDCKQPSRYTSDEGVLDNPEETEKV